MNISIDKNVPIKERREAVIIPYRNLTVGDSVFVKGVTLENVCNRNWRWGKKLGARFTARKEDEGVRIWRTQ